MNDLEEANKELAKLKEGVLALSNKWCAYADAPDTRSRNRELSFKLVTVCIELDNLVMSQGVTAEEATPGAVFEYKTCRGWKNVVITNMPAFSRGWVHAFHDGSVFQIHISQLRKRST